jgi:hypothetical protein
MFPQDESLDLHSIRLVCWSHGPINASLKQYHGVIGPQPITTPRQSFGGIHQMQDAHQSPRIAS